MAVDTVEGLGNKLARQKQVFKAAKNGGEMKWSAEKLSAAGEINSSIPQAGVSRGGLMDV